MSISDLRRQYSKGKLSSSDLTDSPFALFEQWLAEAIKAEIPDPTAMTVATVDADGQPSQRIVLLKEVSESGFVFLRTWAAAKPKNSLIIRKSLVTSPGFLWSDKYGFAVLQNV